MILSKVVRTFHSSRLNTDFQLVKHAGREMKQDTILTLFRVDGNKATPVLRKSYLNKGKASDAILRESHDGDKFVPTTIIVRENKNPAHFGIYRTDGAQTIGDLSKGKVTGICTIQDSTLGGISEEQITPMAERLYNKIFDRYKKELARLFN